MKRLVEGKHITSKINNQLFHFMSPFFFLCCVINHIAVNKLRKCSFFISFNSQLDSVSREWWSVRVDSDVELAEDLVARVVVFPIGLDV